MNEKEQAIADALLEDIMSSMAASPDLRTHRIINYKTFLEACLIRFQIEVAGVKLKEAERLLGALGK